MQFRNIKLDLKNSNTIEFIKKNVREIYSQEIFQWQYGDDKSNLFVVELDTIEGTQGMILSELMYQGKKISSSKSETTYLSEKCRGTGAFEKIYELSTNTAFDSGSQFIWGFTALGKLWKKKLDFDYDDIVSESVIYITPKTEDDFKRRLYKNGMHLFLKFKLLFSKKYTFEVSDELSILNNSEFYGEDAIYMNYESESFINRTKKNPFIHYRMMHFYDDNESIASIIFHVTNHVFVLSDIQYNMNADLRKIMNVIVSYCLKENQITEIRFWANRYNPKYKLVFETMKSFLSKEFHVTDMQLIYKTKLKKFKVEDLFINSLWTEGFKY